LALALLPRARVVCIAWSSASPQGMVRTPPAELTLYVLFGVCLSLGLVHKKRW